MDAPRSLLVEPATRADVRAAAVVLATSLAADPGFSVVLPHARLRYRTLLAVYMSAMRDALRYGRVLVGRDAAGIAGVSIWYPPGSYPMTLLRKLRTLPPLIPLALCAPCRTVGLVRFAEMVERAVPTEGAWYLEALGVRPDAQRQGWGHGLVAPVLAEADSTGLSCYLETAQERNIPYYESLGFHMLDGFVPMYEGGPREARMLRPAVADLSDDGRAQIS